MRHRIINKKKLIRIYSFFYSALIYLRVVNKDRAFVFFLGITINIAKLFIQDDIQYWTGFRYGSMCESATN